MANEKEEAVVSMSDFDASAAGTTLLDAVEEEEEKDKKGNENNDDDGKGAKSKDDVDDKSSEESEEEKDDKSNKGESDDDSEEEDVKDKSTKKKTEKKETKEKADSKEEGDDSFWDDVEKLTGYNVEVDYKGIDPETPEGAALREEAVTRMAVEGHMTQLKDLFPREFRALEHAANGGKMEDLFSPQEPDFSQIEVKEDDVEGQKAQLISYYTTFKGFSAAKARRMVDADEDSEEGLYKATKEAVDERAKAQEKHRAGEEQRIRKQSEAQKKEDMQMVQAVDEVVSKGELGSFRIPKSETEKFENFVFSSVQRNPNGGYTFVQPLESKKLEKQLQAMYFTYKGGDLNKIIQLAAQSENAKSTKRRLKRQKEQKVSSVTEDKGAGKASSMNDFNA